MIIYIVSALLYELVTESRASITGVTYMDNFDFEQRYRNINECNPLYWHPLHLPDDCAEMFETAIRSRIKSNVPVRLVKERTPEVIEMSSPHGTSSGYGAEVFQAPIRTEISYYGHPFGKMLELLSRDVEDQPRAPTVGLLPNVGLVALYQQPISRKSEKMIKKVASVYAPPVSYHAPPYPPPYPPLFIYKPTERSPKSKKEEKSKKKSKGVNGKIKKGNAAAIFQKMVHK